MTPAIPGNERSYGRVVVAIALAALIPALDFGLVAVSLPAIARHFQVDTDAVSWVLLLYLIVRAGFFLMSAALGERRGMKPVFLAGVAVFLAGTLLATFSPRLADLVVARAIQGLGASMLVAPALVAAYLPENARPKALGYMATITALALAIGLILGGVITSFAGWRYVFLVNVPLGVYAFALGRTALAKPAEPEVPVAALRESDGPDETPPVAPPPFDGGGAFLLFAGAVSLLFVVQQGQSLGWTTSPILLAIGLVLVFGFWLVGHERRHPHPIIKIDLLTSRSYLLSLIGYFLITAGAGGVIFLLPFYFEQVRDVAVWTSGLLVAVYAGSRAAVGPVARDLANRSELRTLCAISALVATGGFTLGVFFSPSLAYTLVGLGLVLVGAAIGVFNPAGEQLALSFSSPATHETAVGMLRTFWGVGLAFGIVAFETATRLRAGSLGAGDAPTYELPPNLLAQAQHAGFAVGIAVSLLALLAFVLTRRKRA